MNRKPATFLLPSLLALLLVITTLACSDGIADEDRPRRFEVPLPEVPENLIDLTHGFGPETIYWPTDDQGFHLDTVAKGPTEKGYFYAAHRFSGAEHGGTHLDAPVHFWETGATTDEIPLERLVGQGMVVDVSEAAFKNPDYQVTVADFEEWEKLHGPLLEDSIVLLRTGFGRYWPDRERYLGTALLGEEAIPELHFPGLHHEAAAWLRDERKIRAIGIDTASIDHGQSTNFESHVALFAGGIPAFENVAHMDKLPNKGFLVIALPMKIEGGSGGPLRIIAAW